MLLTISTTFSPATDLSFLLHKHPDRVQQFDLSFGSVRVFYPEASAERTTVALLLEVDPVGIVRRGPQATPLFDQYVNDRPYVASSFLSVALAQVFGTAMGGRCRDRPELVSTPLPLTARLDVLPVRAGEGFLHEVFEPLGYTVDAVRHPLDERFPEWGDSPYYSVNISGTKRLSELLTHLYVLIPVFDSRKHYYVGDDEVNKLLVKGAGWLAQHPLKEQISRRYLNHQMSLAREVLARLVDEGCDEPDDGGPGDAAAEEPPEPELSLHEQRHGAVLAVMRASGAKRVLDLGCGDGKLLRSLLQERQFEQIVGLDVSVRSLEISSRRLKLDRLPARLAERLQLLHGSLMYRDPRLEGFDAAAVVEVIEHLDPPRLAAFERVLFEFARPGTVVLTTPNREYNVMWESLPAGRFRHSDHRFEWTRVEFEAWARGVAARYGYSVRVMPVGPEDTVIGAPSQMGVFQRD